MLQSVLGFLGFGGPEYDAKILKRDARDLIDMVHGQHAAENLANIADVTRTQIAEVHRRGLNDPQYYQQGVEALTEINKAARARRDNVSWSGITLAIVYVKAEMLGDHGLPAKNAIEGFMDKWARLSQEDAANQPPAPPPGTSGLTL